MFKKIRASIGMVFATIVFIFWIKPWKKSKPMIYDGDPDLTRGY